MTRPGSADEGPRFLGELIREHDHLRQQQQAVEKLLAEAARERVLINRRLDAVEATLRAIGCRESDLAQDLATAEGRRQGQNRLLGAIAGPALMLLVWFLSLVWFAVEHSKREEAEWQRQRQQQDAPPQMGPPVPKRLQERQP